jgi:hypothetical protein
VGLGIAWLLDAHANLAPPWPVIRNDGFGVEVVGSRHILILHARFQAKQVFSTGVTSAGGSNSNVYNESYVGNLLVSGDTRKLFNSVSGLWPRTGEGLPLQWSDVPCWVKTRYVTALKIELA